MTERTIKTVVPIVVLCEVTAPPHSNDLVNSYAEYTVEHALQAYRGTYEPQNIEVRVASVKDPTAMSVREAAEIEGLEVFDAALPEPWVTDCSRRGFDVRGHFVWAYDDSLSGYPHPITREGRRIAGRLTVAS